MRCSWAQTRLTTNSRCSPSSQHCIKTWLVLLVWSGRLIWLVVIVGLLSDALAGCCCCWASDVRGIIGNLRRLAKLADVLVSVDVLLEAETVVIGTWFEALPADTNCVAELVNWLGWFEGCLVGCCCCCCWIFVWLDCTGRVVLAYTLELTLFVLPPPLFRSTLVALSEFNVVTPWLNRRFWCTVELFFSLKEKWI